MTIKDAISKVVEGIDLSEEESRCVMDEIMGGEATHSQIASYITAMRMKGETVDEITGAARSMRAKVLTLAIPGPLVDTCGTGGDGANTFNISTVSAFVLAGAQVKVAKHGNRSVSSKCGSADLLSCLGVKVDIDPGLVISCVEEAGIGFMFAPNFHHSMKHAVIPRREIGIRTIFNCLGPLTNPAGAEYQVVGVFSDKISKKLAQVLSRLGTKKSMVVHGHDGLDEITLTTKTSMYEMDSQTVKEYVLDPVELGLELCSHEDIMGGNPKQNAAIALDVLKGKPGPRFDIVALNAAAALVVCGRADNFKEGIDMAKESILTGKAFNALERLKAITSS